MDSDLSLQMVSASAATTRGSVQAAVFKKANEMEQAVVQMVAQSVAPPPAGQGTRIDKFA